MIHLRPSTTASRQSGGRKSATARVTLVSSPESTIFVNGKLASLYFQNNSTKEIIYYIDYLCVNKNERKKGITQQLIQTHEYNQSTVSKTQISFFKREGSVPLLVPFVKYKSIVFSMIYWTLQSIQ